MKQRVRIVLTEQYCEYYKIAPWNQSFEGYIDNDNPMHPIDLEAAILLNSNGTLHSFDPIGA